MGAYPAEGGTRQAGRGVRQVVARVGLSPASVNCIGLQGGTTPHVIPVCILGENRTVN